MLNFDLSTVSQISILVLQIGVIIFAAKFCGDLAVKCKLPSVLGELLAGILIGPYLLGGIPLPVHGLSHGLFGFTQEVAAGSAAKAAVITGEAVIQNITFGQYHLSLYAIATLGSILLLFMSGLETDLRMFFRYSVAGTLVGIGGVIFSYVFGDLIGLWMLHTGNFMDPRCMFLGVLCTATSVGITARILSEKKKIDTPEGVTILAAAVIDDVLGIVCLAIVLGIVGVAGAETVQWGNIGMIALKCIGIWLGATLIGLVLARHIAKFLRMFKSPRVFSMLAFGLALILAGLFEQAGLAMIIGAYVMGLSLSKTDISFAIQRAMTPIYAFLVPVFFVVMGMLADVRVFANPTVLKMGLIYSLLAILAKVIGCALPSLFMNFNLTGALRIGVGMIPRGEVALIIAGIGAGMMMQADGRSIPILNSELFGLAIIMTLATTVIAPPLLSFALGLKGRGVRKETRDLTIVHTPFDFPSRTIKEFTFHRLIEVLENEGYLLSTLDKGENGVIQIRKDDLSFALVVSPKQLVFESTQDEVPFINAVVYETFVDLHKTLGKLKEMASPQDVQKTVYQTQTQPRTPANEPPVNKAYTSLAGKTIHPDCVIMDLQSRTKEGVFKELMDIIAEKNPKIITDKAQCLKDLLEREKVITTCMVNGLALPHGRTNGTTALLGAIGICKSGIQLDAMDGKPTKVFVLCVSPKTQSGPHLEFIAAVATLFREESSVEKLLAARNSSEVLEFFNTASRKPGTSAEA